jgi:hypothetical protein
MSVPASIPRSGAILTVWTEADGAFNRDYYLADRYYNLNEFAEAYVAAEKRLQKLQTDKSVLIASIAVVTDSTDY